MSLRCRFARYCGETDAQYARLIPTNADGNGYWSPVCLKHSKHSADVAPTIYQVPMRNIIYLLHFSEPLSDHAGHYLGYTDDLPARLEAHRAGRGARITRAASLNGISLIPSRLWRGDRHRERALKKQKHLDRLCPVCRPSGRAERAAHRTSSRKYPKLLNGRSLNALNGPAGALSYRLAGAQV